MKIQSPPGMRDFFPDDMRVQNWLFDAWRGVSRAFGFSEFEGPIFEFLELYTIKSGDGIVSELFNFQDRGGRAFAIRPEMTPTLARMVAAKANALPRPIKWFCMPRLCRAEKPQRGRLREFFQWNVDTLGQDDVLADAEVIAVLAEFYRRVGVTPAEVAVRVSSRPLAAALLAGLGLSPADAERAFALIDKYDAANPEEFRRKWRDGDVGRGSKSVGAATNSKEARGDRELARDGEQRGPVGPAAKRDGAVKRDGADGAGGADSAGGADRVDGAGGGNAQARMEEPSRAMAAPPLGTVIAVERVEALFNAPLDECVAVASKGGESGAAAGEQLRKLFGHLAAFGVADYCKFDPTIVRGLAYYTGPVFEASAKTVGLRALAGGGRYDNLTELLDGPRVTGVGFGMGDAPNTEFLREIGKLPTPGESLDVYVVDADEKLFPAALEIVSKLRRAGIAADFSFKRGGLGKQLKSATARGARFAVIVGQEYAERGELAVKDLGAGEQRSVAAAAIFQDAAAYFAVRK